MEYYSSLDASQLSSNTPTLFELISARQLESLLSPSLRYILVHYATKYPYYLLRIMHNFDELNLIIRSFIEWYFLKYWQGSFTENFYGLKRVRSTPLASNKYNSEKLTQFAPSVVEERRRISLLQEFVSLIEVTGTAYVSEKLNYWYEIWYPKYITNGLVPQQPDSRKEIIACDLKKKFVEWFPLVQSLFRTGNFITVLLYLGGRSKSPSLLMTLFKINYARLSQHDYSKYESKLHSGGEKQNLIHPPSSSAQIFSALKATIFRPSWKVIRYIFGTFFPAAIFTLKFLEWYNSTNFAQKISKSSDSMLQNVLPPLTTLSKIQSREKKKPTLYKSGKNCPLCKNEISNPAIIETGYVFCYSCIYNYLSESHKIIGRRKKTAQQDAEESEVSDFSDENEQGRDEDKDVSIAIYNIDDGGRCPITGKKLLGCKWNTLKEEWEIEGIRRLIF